MGHTTRRCPSREWASGLVAPGHTCIQFRRAVSSKTIRTFVLLAATILLLATAAIRDLRADNLYPNCIITAIDANSGLVTSQETSSGKTFYFQVTDRAQLEHVRIHQGIWINNGQVSFKTALAQLVEFNKAQNKICDLDTQLLDLQYKDWAACVQCARSQGTDESACDHLKPDGNWHPVR
jgi:hypothetical protein